MQLLSDSALVFQRSLAQTLRNPVWLIFNLTQPILYLVLFGPLLERVASAQGFPPDGAYNVFVPGLLVQLGFAATVYAGFNLLADLRNGVIERLQVTPIHRLALLLGRSARDVLGLACQALTLVLLALPFGLKVDVVGALTAIALVLVLGLAFSALSYNLALLLRSEDALQPVLFTASLPLMLLSGVLLPLSLAPAWLRRLADLNPLSHAVSASRALFNGHFGDRDVVVGLLVVVALAAVNVTLAARRIERAAA
ncbi:MAG: ABC transporter permease [Chloroflexi bacterium]|nr:ABC transporter permease [Chloroflexota bacterium]